MANAGRVYLVASGNDGSLEAMAARALAETGTRAPRVAVSYAPIADSPEQLASMVPLVGELFKGAEVMRVALEGEVGAMNHAAARDVVERADLVFVVGGDPVLGVKILGAARAEVWLRAARARGAAMLGVSAGSILLGAWWAAWPDAFAQGTLVECTRVAGGLVIDCHDEASDWEELRLVKQMCESKGLAERARFIGIPTGGAIVVHSDGSHETVGKPPFHLT